MSCNCVAGADADDQVLLSPGVPLTPYWKMSEKDREARKAYARERYQDPVIKDRMGRNQYMKCLRSRLIQKTQPKTFANMESSGGITVSFILVRSTIPCKISEQL